MEIRDIIRTLTEEEKILHKGLIDECFQREAEVNIASKLTRDSLKSFEVFAGQLEQLFSALNVLNKELSLYYEETIPDENYYRYLN